MPETTTQPSVKQSPVWHNLTGEAVAQHLTVDPAKGLSSAEVSQRLQKNGPNVLAEKKAEPRWQAFLRPAERSA